MSLAPWLFVPERLQVLLSVAGFIHVASSAREMRNWCSTLSAYRIFKPSQCLRFSIRLGVYGFIYREAKYFQSASVCAALNPCRDAHDQEMSLLCKRMFARDDDGFSDELEMWDR